MSACSLLICLPATYSAWHLKATPNVELKYSSHTTCNPKNSAYLCNTSHAEQSYATRLSKSFFLAEILPVEIDDFCPNLAKATHIWPQGFMQRTRSASWSQQLPSFASGDASALRVPSSPCNGQAACSPAGLATPPTVHAPAPLRPRQAFPRLQTQALPPTKQCPCQARQRQHQRSSHHRTQSPPPPPFVQTHPCRDVPTWPQPVS